MNDTLNQKEHENFIDAIKSVVYYAKFELNEYQKAHIQWLLKELTK